MATHVLEEGVLNAFILYKKFSPNPKKHCDFIRLALEAMLEDGKRTAMAAADAAPATPLPRVLGTHHPSLIPGTPNKEFPQKKVSPLRSC